MALESGLEWVFGEFPRRMSKTKVEFAGDWLNTDSNSKIVRK
jgi:hypothetical protein